MRINKIKVKTKVRQGDKGHYVLLQIGHQGFRMTEQEAEEGLTSEQYANWYKRQLDFALKSLKS
jgi:hypothetical protein